MARKRAAQDAGIDWIDNDAPAARDAPVCSDTGARHRRGGHGDRDQRQDGRQKPRNALRQDPPVDFSRLKGWHAPRTQSLPHIAEVAVPCRGNFQGCRHPCAEPFGFGNILAPIFSLFIFVDLAALSTRIIAEQFRAAARQNSRQLAGTHKGGGTYISDKGKKFYSGI